MSSLSDFRFGMSERIIAADAAFGQAARLLLQNISVVKSENPLHAKAEISKLIKALNIILEDCDSFDRTPSETTHINNTDTSDRIASQSLYSIVEEDVIEFLGAQPEGLTIEDLMELFEMTGVEIKRATLIVYLRRMTTAGLIKTKTRGQYLLAGMP